MSTEVIIISLKNTLILRQLGDWDYFLFSGDVFLKTNRIAPGDQQHCQRVQDEKGVNILLTAQVTRMRMVRVTFEEVTS